MTVKFEGITGNGINWQTHKRENVQLTQTINTGHRGIIPYGEDAWAGVVDNTDDPGKNNAEISIGYYPKETTVFVAKGTSAPAESLGLPSELGTITVK